MVLQLLLPALPQRNGRHTPKHYRGTATVLPLGMNNPPPPITQEEIVGSKLRASDGLLLSRFSSKVSTTPGLHQTTR